ncbi:MAG: hypothetical protein E7614_07695 [Ruminococcaceae bacterium]|nr:hypothetical protein [Oscillospiraceae bacterium]
MTKNKKRTDRKKEFEYFKEKYLNSKNAFEAQRKLMDNRELLYRGTKTLFSPSGEEAEKSATHVRNIVFENIESEIDSSIPAPKVTAKRKEDEWLAEEIEDMLKNILDVLPFEQLNDLQERTAYIQGGSYFLCEWDDTVRKKGASGEIAVSVEHPKQVIPQDGIYGSTDNMDYIFIESARTRGYLKKRYGFETEDAEAIPDIRGVTDISAADDLVTVVTGFFKNGEGSIGRIVFTGDTLLEYLNDYQSRYVSRCVKCGEIGKDVCTLCGGEKFILEKEDSEELFEDIVCTDGRVISCIPVEKDEDGYLLDDEPMEEMAENPYVDPLFQPVGEMRRVPYYKPNVYPLILRKNVSVFGQLLGESDVDVISDQQNTIKMLSTKIKEKLLKGGSVLTLPIDVDVETTDEEFKIMRIESPDKMNMMQVFNIQADISGDLTYMQHVYNEAREILGITDSFQGRSDSTATSGIAKEFAAAQSAGRLESKRVMKNAAYAKLYETIFKFMLAYADEPRTLVSMDGKGNRVYGHFNRYDFLCEDEYGELYWNDDFIFSCDDSSSLGKDREKMWAETRNNLASGTFGDPTSVSTLVLFWNIMERFHYPGAAEIKAQLMEQSEEQKLTSSEYGA